MGSEEELRMEQKLEQQRVAAAEAADQARDAARKAVAKCVKWYVTRVGQEKERRGLQDDKVPLSITLADDPEWQQVEAKFDTLMRLFDAACESSVLWPR